MPVDLQRFAEFFRNNPQDLAALQALSVKLDELDPERADASVYEVPSTSSFREQAERESSAFFDKDLDLAMRELEQARTQARQTKEQAEKFQQEDYGAFQGIQDRNFARALSGAQYGFAGRGTANSGFRNKAIGEMQTDQDQTLSDAEREQRQATEQRNLGFEQFLQGSELQEERTRLGIERSREGEILSRQEQLANQESARRSNVLSQSDRNFNRTLSFGNFINDKLLA